MRDRFGIALRLALVLALVGSLASAAGAAKSKARPLGKAGPLLRSETFSTSGDFSGVLNGEIWMDGVGYTLSTDALVYEIDRGVLPLGTVVSDRMVWLSGLKSGSSMMVYSVVIRPGTYVRAVVTEPSDQVRVADESRPQ